MTFQAEFVLRFVVGLAISVAITWACYAVMSMFIWWWLALMLSVLADFLLCKLEVVQAAKITAADAAVTGCAKALNWYRSLKAEKSAEQVAA